MNLNKYKGKIIRWKNLDMRVLSVQRWISSSGDTKYRIKTCPSTAGVPKVEETMLITVRDMKQVAEWRRAYADNQFNKAMKDAEVIHGQKSWGRLL